MQKKANVKGDELTIPRAQRRRPAPPLNVMFGRHADRDEGIIAAYDPGVYSYGEIAEYLGLHPATVGRIVRTGMLQCEN